MKKSLALSLGLVLVASAAMASNTGFKLNYTLAQPPSTSANNWISVPYFYFPDGNVSNTAQTSVDFCNDLNEGVAGSKVSLIFRFNTAADSVDQQDCNDPVPTFNLKKGEGYSLIPASNNIVVNIVGSHDDTFAKLKTPTPVKYTLSLPAGTSSNNWFSVPYHIKANDSVELCKDLNDQNPANPNVALIFRFNTAADSVDQQDCNDPVPTWTLKTGEGVSLVPTANNAGVTTEVY